MQGPKFLIGGAKALFYIRLSIHTFLRYLGRLISGKIGVTQFLRLQIRLLLFLKAVRHNKVVVVGGTYKIQLYLPAYPNPAF